MPARCLEGGRRAPGRCRYDDRMPWNRVLIAWSLIALTESVSGALRQLYLAPRIGDVEARHVGVTVDAVLILLLAILCSRWIGLRDRLAWMRVGLVWALLTVAFEYTLGRALGLSADRILADYDPSRGGLLALGIIWLIYAPRVAAKLRGTLS